MKKEITYWKGINLGPQRKEWMKKNLRLEEIEAPTREVLDKCNCPMCSSDDIFSFQTRHKCRSCDYKFTK